MTIVVGNQTPTYQWAPQSFSDASYREAVEVSDRANITLDPWQHLILKGGLGETANFRFACFEVCGIVGRQNGKGGIIEVRELAGMFAFHEKLITHSSHEFKTSSEAFRRMLVFIESVPDFDAQVLRISRSKGEEGIELTKDRRLRYMARTGGAGRGFTGDLVILDEAMILDDLPISALVPTMATKPDPQIWYFGSAGDRRLPSQSKVLARVRRRGLRKEPNVALYMWEAHRRHERGKCKPDCRLDSRTSIDTWAKTNPALGIRIEASFLQKMIGTMSGWDFDREFLGAGDYPEDEGWVVVNRDTWNDLADPYPDTAGCKFAVAFEARYDRSEASLAVVYMRKDGYYHGEVIRHELGTHWIKDAVKAIRKLRPVAIVANPKGPANIIIPELEALKMNLYKPAVHEIAAFSAKWLQLVTETGEFKHNDQEVFNNCVAAARTRDLGQGIWTWEHENVPADVSGLAAVTLALGGLIVKGGKGSGHPRVGVA